MNLELKHLAYFPYGVRFVSSLDKPFDEFGNNPAWTLNGVTEMFGDYCLMTKQGNDAYPIQKCKLVLRPLSDLIKYVDCPEVMGEKILHVRELIKIADGYVADDDNLNQWWFNYINDISKYPRYVHELINRHLLKHHFDIFNLIPNNLAIDINTLK